MRRGRRGDGPVRADPPPRPVPARSGARAPVVVLAALLAGGCGQDRDSPATDGDTGAVPSRVATETLAVGEVAGPEAYSFGRVTGLAADDRGRIYVADHQASEVRVFDRAGEHLQTVGRHGQGPGELDGPCCLTVDDRGRLWVRETGNNRYTIYDVRADGGATFVETRRMQHGAGGLWAPVHVVGDSVIDVGAEFGSEDRLRWLVGPEGSARELPRAPGRPLSDIGAGLTITRSVEGGTARRFFYRPFGPRHLLAFGPDGAWADAVSSEYRVVIHPAGGDSAVVVGPAAPGPELSPAEAERARRDIERSREWAGSDADRIDFDVPARKQPLRDLFFDEEGRLWVERSVPDGAPREADLYGPDGVLLERRAWTGDVDVSLPGWVGEHAALGVRTDSLGVQRVVRLEWPTGG